MASCASQRQAQSFTVSRSKSAASYKRVQGWLFHSLTSFSCIKVLPLLCSTRRSGGLRESRARSQTANVVTIRARDAITGWTQDLVSFTKRLSTRFAHTGCDITTACEPVKTGWRAEHRLTPPFRINSECHRSSKTFGRGLFRLHQEFWRG